MDKDEWISNRTYQLQIAREKRIAEAEENGYPNYDGDDVSWEEAEQEYNSLYGEEEED